MPPRQPIHATRGVRDLLPDELRSWRLAEATARRVAAEFGYREIRTPAVEPAELVERGVGDSTEVVTKEMYRFQDLGQRWLVLRPEFTASVVRAYHDGGLVNETQPQRLWSIGPAWRYERPQKGRYREFWQFNAEAIGDASPAVDAELIELGLNWYARLGLQRVGLAVNSVGDANCRPAYVSALVAYFTPLREQLCEDCQLNLVRNPLRILDCKRDVELRAGAPVITDHLCGDCRDALATVRSLLDAAGIEYVMDPTLVRGLDYYRRTAWEFWHASLDGRQGAIGGGGRYDGLAETIGWPATPGVGFASGLDRVVSVMASDHVPVPEDDAPMVMIVAEDAGCEVAAAAAARASRTVVATVADYSDRSIRAKMKGAIRQGCRVAVLVGNREVATDTVRLRDLKSGEQRVVAIGELAAALALIAEEGQNK